MKPITSYPVMKPHFNKVRLFSQLSIFSKQFNKTRYQPSTHMITVAYAYTHHRLISINFQNFTKFISF